MSGVLDVLVGDTVDDLLDVYKRQMLAYWRGGDELRVKMASEVPYTRKPKGSGAAGGSSSQPSRAQQSIETGSRETERKADR